MDPSYNNPFAGSNPVYPQAPAPVVSGGGDIVLPKQSKSKKSIVMIVVAVFVIALLGLGIWWLLVNKGVVAKNTFNEYANFLLYGESSSNNIEGEYSWGYRYYARDYDVVFDGHYKDYLDSLKEKYEKFYNESNEKNSEYDDIFWLFYYTAYYPDIERSDVLNATDKTAEEIAAAVKDYYEPFSESSNEMVKLYGEQRVKLLLDGNSSEDVFPDYNIEIFAKIWELKDAFGE